MGKFFEVDLTGKTTATLPLSPELQRSFIGGKGFCAKMLYELIPQDTDPLSPDNVLLFLTGPLTGTTAPAMCGVAGTKSPLTGTYLDSFFGGHFAPATKYAGYDGIIIRGRAEELCYVSIEDDTVVIKSAAAMRGLGTIAAAEAVKKDLEDFDYTVSTIGKAGEKGVLYSLIGCEYNRQAGRGGAGAVMGSKNLKAVAVKGSNLVHVHNQEKFARAVLTARKELAESGDVKALANS